jgi:nucleotide-binding universal stress UspA family protein
MYTVLAALDGSSRSRGVLAAAVAAARAHSGRLVLMRAVGLPADVPQEFWKTTDKPFLDLLEEQARMFLVQQQAEVPATLRGGVHVVVGAPWQAICRTVQTVHADLLVVGSHGYGGIDRLLGTTAAKVVNHSSCSVLVVKEGAIASDPHTP